jgi:hypothetical protein
MHYDGEVISCALNPLGSMGYYAVNPDIGQDVRLFFRRDLVLWLVGGILVWFCLLSRASRSAKGMAVVFPLVSILFIYACSKRGCLTQYLIFSEIPLELGIVSCVSILINTWRSENVSGLRPAILLLGVSALAVFHSWYFNRVEFSEYYAVPQKVNYDYIDSWLYGPEGQGVYFWREYSDRMHELYADESQFNTAFDRLPPKASH